MKSILSQGTYWDCGFRLMDDYGERIKDQNRRLIVSICNKNKRIKKLESVLHAVLDGYAWRHKSDGVCKCSACKARLLLKEGE